MTKELKQEVPEGQGPSPFGWWVRRLALAAVFGIACVLAGLTMIFIGIWTEWEWIATGVLLMIVGVTAVLIVIALDG